MAHCLQQRCVDQPNMEQEDKVISALLEVVIKSKYVCYTKFNLNQTDFVILLYYMASQRPGRYLETFLESVGPLWLSISPGEAMAILFMSKIIIS